jgi:hypothetical protein
MRQSIGVGVAVAIAAALLPATGLALKPAAGARLIEDTDSGYLLTLKISRSGKTGSLKVTCPSGKGIGTDSFDIKHGAFRAKKPGVWKFSGRFDTVDHFKGKGSVIGAHCGAGAPKKIYEPLVGTPQWTQCPTGDPFTPAPSNTPFTFVGMIPAAAIGSSVLIEYQDASGPAGASHVTTGRRGVFQDVHAFPATGFAYSASATIRYPDNPLPTGVVCNFTVK